MVNKPTRGNNILDLILANKPELLFDINVCEGLANSDHDAIEFGLKVKISRRKCSRRLIYDYKAANWKGLKDDFANICTSLSSFKQKLISFLLSKQF